MSLLISNWYICTKENYIHVLKQCSRTFKEWVVIHLWLFILIELNSDSFYNILNLFLQWNSGFDSKKNIKIYTLFDESQSEFSVTLFQLVRSQCSVFFESSTSLLMSRYISQICSYSISLIIQWILVVVFGIQQTMKWSITFDRCCWKYIYMSALTKAEFSYPYSERIKKYVHWLFY